MLAETVQVFSANVGVILLFGKIATSLSARLMSVNSIRLFIAFRFCYYYYHHHHHHCCSYSVVTIHGAYIVSSSVESIVLLH